jgi:DNA-binding XRE family transcriptional regulator
MSIIGNMKNQKSLSLSASAKSALDVLGQLIKAARLERGMSQVELAERVGVSRHTVMAIEKADPKVAIGVVLESATVLGLPLLAEDTQSLNKLAGTVAHLATLLPARSTRKHELNDDF